MSTVMSPQDALIAVMMLVSAADRNMTDSELREIVATIDVIPALKNYDRDRIAQVSTTVVELLQQEDGIETLLGLVKTALPARSLETAYALACDVAAADGEIQLEEARLLEMIRYELDIERLIAAGIERGSRARHMPLA